MSYVGVPFIRVRKLGDNGKASTVQNIAVDSIKTVGDRTKYRQGRNTGEIRLQPDPNLAYSVGEIQFKGDSSEIITVETSEHLLMAMNIAVFHANQPLENQGVILINAETLQEIELNNFGD